MLAALTYSSLSDGRRTAEPVDLDPGFISLVTAAIRYLRQRRADAAEAHAATLIAANGGRLTDSIERRIASSAF
jgi:hypothetical protein